MSDFVGVDVDPEDEPEFYEEEPETLAPNPDAPYGYKADGTPYKRRPNGTGRTTSKKGGRKRKASVDYAGIVNDLIMSVATPLAIAGAATQNPSLIATSWVLGERANPVSEAFGDIALQNEKIARGLEKIAEVSPYAALTAAIMPAIPQLLVNFGVLQPGIMNTIDPKTIAAGYYQSQGQPVPNFDAPSTNGNGQHADTEPG